MSKSQIQVATYNLLAGSNAEKLLATITHAALRNPTIFVFQEVPKENGTSPFLKAILHTLGPTFKHSTFFAADDTDLGLTICWNSKQAASLRGSVKKIFFTPHVYSFWEKLIQRFIVGLNAKPLKRRALSATFRVYGKTVRVTNIHLNIEGSWQKRQENLSFLLKQLQNDTPNVDCDIILGDFNTLYLSRKKEHQEQTVIKQTLNQTRKPGNPAFVDLTARIDYTNDAIASYTYPTWLNRALYGIMHALGLHAYRKLDYIWAKRKNTRTQANAEVLFEGGSDHFPVVATLEL